MKNAVSSSIVGGVATVLSADVADISATESVANNRACSNSTTKARARTRSAISSAALVLFPVYRPFGYK